MHDRSILCTNLQEERNPSVLWVDNFVCWQVLHVAYANGAYDKSSVHENGGSLSKSA